MTTIFFSIIFFAFSVLFLLYIFNAANILRNTLLRKEAPYIPLSKNVLERAAEEMAITDRSLVYDLGCGDGRVLFSLAKKYPQGRYIGVEKYALPFLLAQINLFFHGRPKKIKIIKKDMFDCDFHEASHIFLYLFPGHVDRIYDKLEKELKKGTCVISCGFHFKKKNAQKVIEIPRNTISPGTYQKIYVYEF
jgi:SAM-dependent methyltransferase